MASSAPVVGEPASSGRPLAGGPDAVHPIPARRAVGVERWTAFLLYLALVVIHLGFALTMSGPVVYSDEGGYMGTARVLVSGHGLLYSQAPYHPGYSVLLVPLVKLFPGPLRSYEATLILNALLLAAIGVGVFELTRWWLPKQSMAVRLAIAAVVASYPAFLDYSNLVMSMNLFIPLFVSLCVTLGWAFERDRPAPWLLAGASAGALYVVHPIGLVAMVAVAALSFAIRRPRKVWFRSMVAVAIGLALALIPGILLINHVVHVNNGLAATPAARATAPPPAGGNRTLNTGRVLARNLSPSHLLNSLYALAGQLFYLAVGTYGLWVLGVAVALAAAWRVWARRSTDTGDRLAVFIGAVGLATLVSSSLRFTFGPGSTHGADELIYGRYNELVLAPVVALGAVSLAGLPRRAPAEGSRRRRAGPLTWPVATVMVLTVIAASGTGLWIGRSPSALRSVFADINVIALHPLLTWLGGIDVLAIALVGGAAATAVVLLARWIGIGAVAVPVVAASVLSAAFTAHRLSGESRGRTNERVIIHAVDAVAARSGPLPACIGYDIPMEHVWHLYNDQFFLADRQFRRFDSALAERPCSDLVISGRGDFEADYPGAGLMALENFSPTKLWVLPGPLLTRLRAAGDILPAGFPTALPDRAYRSSMRVVGTSARAGIVPYGSARDVLVAVTHAGAGSPWPSRRGFVAGKGWVRLSVKWFRPADRATPVGEGSVDLPRSLFPGETIDVKVPLVPRAFAGGNLAPDEYVVQIGLVQDGYTYFVDKGDSPLTLAVSVGARR